MKNKWSLRESAFKEIGIGIGITSGKVFIGNIGSEKRFDFTVIGLDVNLAQRLASDADSDQILISKSIKEQIDNEFNIKEKSLYSLKGIKKGIPIYIIN